jgi:hypothetical protein
LYVASWQQQARKRILPCSIVERAWWLGETGIRLVSRSEKKIRESRSRFRDAHVNELRAGWNVPFPFGVDTLGNTFRRLRTQAHTFSSKWNLFKFTDVTVTKVIPPPCKLHFKALDIYNLERTRNSRYLAEMNHDTNMDADNTNQLGRIGGSVGGKIK